MKSDEIDSGIIAKKPLRRVHARADSANRVSFGAIHIAALLPVGLMVRILLYSPAKLGDGSGQCLLPWLRIVPVARIRPIRRVANEHHLRHAEMRSAKHDNHANEELSIVRTIFGLQRLSRSGPDRNPVILPR